MRIQSIFLTIEYILRKSEFINKLSKKKLLFYLKIQQKQVRLLARIIPAGIYQLKVCTRKTGLLTRKKVSQTTSCRL